MGRTILESCIRSIKEGVTASGQTEGEVLPQKSKTCAGYKKDLNTQ